MSKLKSKRKQSTASFPSIVIMLCSVIFVLVVLYIFQTMINNTPETINSNAAGQVAWPMFGFDSQKSSDNQSESIITKNTVAQLKQLWQVNLPDVSDGTPVYLSGVNTSKGSKNLVFVTSKGGSLFAIDDTNGSIVWQQSTQGNSGEIDSSPAIDPNQQFVYSYGSDGKVHKYAVATGAESTGGGWPLTATLIPDVEKGSSDLSIGNGYLYVTTSAYPGDQGPYVGHIVAINLTTGATTVFNSLCTNTKTMLNGNCGSVQSGVWGRPGAVIDPVSGNVFIATGNGPYNAPGNLGDSIIELTPNLSQIIDTYTPANFQTLDDADEDLGSTEPAMIPTQTGGNPPEIAVQGSKDNTLRVVNRQNLSGQNGPFNVGGELQSLPVDCNIFSQPLAWNNGSMTWVFVTDMCNNLYAYKVVDSRLQQVYEKNNIGRSSPIVINGMLFIQNDGAVNAIDPTTGNMLWTGNVGGMHWQSPIVVNGKLFVLTSDGKLTAFGVNLKPTTQPTPFPTALPTLTPTPIIPTYYILQLGRHTTK